MTPGIAAERRLLADDEYGPVAETHYSALRERLIELARWLRARRDRAAGIIADYRRTRRGKAGEHARQGPGERGITAEKQIFARALRRVNARIAALAAA